jgi:hypothetical protein
MPVPYAVRGGYRAVFTRGVLESVWTAGYDGSGPTTLTEYTDEGAREITLRESQGYPAVIDHVVDCLRGEAVSRIDAGSVLDALQLTVDVHTALTAQRADMPPAGDERMPS